MPYINCYVDDRTLAILQRESTVRGITVNSLAERAIESVAISQLPSGCHYPAGFNGDHWPRDHRMDLGDTSIGLREHDDGSMSVVTDNHPPRFRLTCGGVGIEGFDSFDSDDLRMSVIP